MQQAYIIILPMDQRFTHKNDYKYFNNHVNRNRLHRKKLLLYLTV